MRHQTYSENIAHRIGIPLGSARKILTQQLKLKKIVLNVPQWVDL